MKQRVILLSLIILVSSIGLSSSACVDANCKTCADEAVCTECNDNTFFLKVGTCVKDCGEKFFKSGQNCAACEGSCQTCSDSTTCTTCPTGKLKLSDTKICVDACPSTYFNSSTTDCTKCLDQCATCENTSSCKTCPTGKFILSDTKLCVDACPSTYFNSSATDCTKCLGDCATCENTSGCKTCPSGQFLKLDDKRCVVSCPAKYFASSATECSACASDCATCEDASNCKTCASGQFLLSDTKRCSSTCPSGYYSSNSSCIKCDAQCNTCSESGKCLTCPGSFRLLSDTKQCIQTCPTEAYVEDTTSNTCLKCADRCKTCSLFNQQTCSSCLGNNRLQLSSCVETCSLGYYPSANDTTRCEPCTSGCTNCTSATQCNTCDSKYYSFVDPDTNNTKCALKCINQVDALGLRICDVCENEQNSSVCTTCKAGYKRTSGGLCFRCQDLTGPVKDGDTYTCKRCKDSNCLSCTTPNDTSTELSVCSTCSNGYYLNATSNTCTKCDDKCSSCTNSTTCTACKAPSYVLNGSTCVDYPCAENKYYNPNVLLFSERCQSCLTNCLVCDRFNSEVCRVCDGNRIYDPKLKSCKLPAEIKEVTCQFGAYPEIDGTCVCPQTNYYYSDVFGCRKISNESCDSCYIDSRALCTDFSFISSCQSGCLVQQTETSSSCMQCRQFESYDIDNDTLADRIETPQYLDANGKCQKCKEGCRVCVNQNGCRECLPNYVMTVLETQEVTCTKPVSASQICADGYLPSTASIYSLNKNITDLNSRRAEIFTQYSSSSDLFSRESNLIAIATGIFGEPLIQNDTIDERKILFDYNPTTGILQHTYYETEQSDRFYTNVSISLQCLPCLYNCNNKCAPKYFLETNSQRCYLRCPSGFSSNIQTFRCDKITSNATVMIRSLQLGVNGQFINQGNLNLEAIVQDFKTLSNKTLQGYTWSITVLNSPFSVQTSTAASLIPISGTTLAGNIPLTSRTLSIPSSLLLPGVSYKVDVSFQSDTTVLRTSQVIKALPPDDVVTFESQGLAVNQIVLSESVVQTGDKVILSYILNDVPIFQNASWMFKIQADWIETQYSTFLIDNFTIQTPFVESYTTIDIKFDATDGVVTYRTIRQLAVTGIENKTNSIATALDQLVGATNSSFVSAQTYLEPLPQLLTNLKKSSTANQSQYLTINSRVAFATFLDEGTCLVNSDCGSPTTVNQGECKRVNDTDPDNLRQKCVCTANFAGSFCQLKKTFSDTYTSKVSSLLIKITKFLNTTTVSSKIEGYDQFLQYYQILVNSIDFVNSNSLFPFSFILHKIQKMAITSDQISTISMLTKRIYDYYWNTIDYFKALEDKTVTSQIEAVLYNLTRISLLQQAKMSLSFATANMPLSMGTFIQGSVIQKDTVGDLKTSGFTTEFKQGSDTMANITYSYSMVEDAQVVGIFSAKVSQNIFKNVPVANLTIADYYKITAVDLSNNDYEEIKKTDKANGVSIFFTNLPTPGLNKKRACAYYDDIQAKFVLDNVGDNGCVLNTFNKTSGTETVVDTSVVQCVCNHNTIFTLAEYNERATPRTKMNNSSILSSALVTIILALVMVLF